MAPSPPQVPGPSQLRMIGLGLGFGSSAFLLAALFMPQGGDGGGTGKPAAALGTLEILSLVHAGIFVAGLVASMWVFGKRREVARSNHDPLRFAAAQITRWALLEGPALLGIVILLLARMQDVLPANQWIYANLSSYAVFLAVLILDLFGELEVRANSR